MPEQLDQLPSEVASYAFPCGNPVHWSDLRKGEKVLDLGCGAGLDVILAAQAVGKEGKVWGLDLSRQMLELTARHCRQMGILNIELLYSNMESIPLANDMLDVVLSNCSLSLVPDREKVLREVFRVLRPGGRLVAADTIRHGSLPAEIKEETGAWIWGLAGATTEEFYRCQLQAIGFTKVKFERQRKYYVDSGEARGGFAIFSTALWAWKPLK